MPLSKPRPAPSALVIALAILGVTAPLGAQPRAVPIVRVGLETRVGPGTQLGPVVAVDVLARGPLALRLDVGAFKGLSSPNQVMISVNAQPDQDRRGAAWVGTASLITEYALGGVAGSGAFVTLQSGVTVTEWGRGVWHEGYPPHRDVFPKGTSSTVAHTGIGLGVDFAAFKSRTRLTARVERHFDAVAYYDAVRFGVARVW